MGKQSSDIATAQDGRVFNLMAEDAFFTFKSPNNAEFPGVVNSNWAGPFGLDSDIGLSGKIIFDEKRQVLYRLSYGVNKPIQLSISGNNGMMWDRPITISESNNNDRVTMYYPVDEDLVINDIVIRSAQLDYLVSNIKIQNPKYSIPPI